MMTKKQAEDVNKIFRQNSLQINKLKKEIDSLKVLPPHTLAILDTLKLTDTIKNIVTVTDTIGPRLRGSVLLPRGEYWLYTFNEKNQRYEMDPNTLQALKEQNQERVGLKIIAVWSTTVIFLTSLIFFLGV